MRPEGIFIGLVVFSVFITVAGIIIADVNTNYNKDLSTTEFKKTFEVINQTYNLSTKIDDRLYNQELGDESSLDALAKNAFGAIRYLKGSFNLINNIFNDVAKLLNIPALFIQAFMLILVISSTWFGIYFVRGFKPRD